eukprot:scaffold706_cov418-Prasinococcus_capsulatus_cf.AAC.30
MTARCYRRALSAAAPPPHALPRVPALSVPARVSVQEKNPGPAPTCARRQLRSFGCKDGRMDADGSIRARFIPAGTGGVCAMHTMHRST